MMARPIGFLLILFVILSWTPVVLDAQDEISEQDISAALDEAFENFKSERGISFHPSVEAEWKKEYMRVMREAMNIAYSSECKDPMRASTYINEMSEPSNIEKRLEKATKEIEEGEDHFELWGGLFGKVWESCRGAVGEGGIGTESKYSYLAIRTEPKEIEATVYIDQKRVGQTPDNRRYVVPRGQEFLLEIKSEGCHALNMKVTVDTEEPKTVRYVARAKEQ